jgi:hypothetical protein
MAKRQMQMSTTTTAVRKGLDIKDVIRRASERRELVDTTIAAMDQARDVTPEDLRMEFQC